MSKVQVEFINTCHCCDEYAGIIRSLASKYIEEVELKVYYAGKDSDYLKKYGRVTRGTMIINGKKRLDALSKEIIEKAIVEAVGDNGH